MRIGRIAGLFQGRPQHPVGPDGRMALSDHFREFRARLMRCLLALALAFAVAIIFRHALYDAVYGPYTEAQKTLPEGTSEATTSGAGAGLLLWLTLGGFAAAIVTAPYWLYQVWAFVLPGLYAQERKMTRIFTAVAGPLFIAGVVLGYVTLPVALKVLIGFNPDGVVNLIDFNDYLQFFTRTLFVFAAVATPSADPFTMTLMAVPMVLLFFASEAIARFNDKRRARRAPNAGLSPDELSSI